MENQSVSEVARKWVREASDDELEAALRSRQEHKNGTGVGEVSVEQFDAEFASKVTGR